MREKSLIRLVLVLSLLSVMLLMTGSALASPLVEWNQTYGAADEDFANSVVQTGDGGYAIAGYTSSFGAGNDDVWLVKTDSAGNMLWNKTYGGSSGERAYSIVQTADEGYAMAGYTESFGAGSVDLWLVKTDADGNMLWSKAYGGADSEGAYSLVQTSDGGYAIAGDFGPWWDRDFWLVKTDASGNMLWEQTYGGANHEISQSLVQTSDGGYALVGYTESSGAGFRDFWLVKTDADGNMLWNQTYGGTSGDWAISVVQTDDGGYAIAGFTWSFGVNRDAWLVKTDATGNMQWNQTYGGADEDHTSSVVQTDDGGYALAGGTYSFGAGGLDAWLVKTDASGNMQWNQTYGGTIADVGNSLVQTSDGGYAMAADTRSIGAGGNDAWLIKLAPEETQVLTLTITITQTRRGSTEIITLELIDEDQDGVITQDLHNRILAAIKRTHKTTTFDFPGEYTATKGAWIVSLSGTNDFTVILA